MQFGVVKKVKKIFIMCMLLVALSSFIYAENVTVEVVLFEDTFTSAGGLSVDTIEGSNTAPWERGTLTEGGKSCYDDSFCWGTSLTANYQANDGADEYEDALNLTVPLNLSGRLTATLTFYHYRDMQSPAQIFDGAVLDIDYNGSWSRLTPQDGYTGTVKTGTTNVLSGEQGYGKDGGAWELETFNLTPFLGNEEVYIRWFFATDDSTSGQGWYIDNVRIVANQTFNSDPDILSVNISSSLTQNIHNITCDVALNGSATTSVISWTVNSTPLMLLNMPFEGNSSNALKDYSGRGNDISSSDATWSVNGGRNGNGAFEFDQSQTVGLHVSGTETSFKADGNYTYALWVKSNAGNTGNEEVLIADESANAGFDIWYSSETEISLWNNNGGTVAFGPMSMNEWHHLVITYDAGSVGLYVDTVLIGSGSGTFADSTNNVVLGISDVYPTGFNGSISEFRMYNRTLSLAQITTLYENNSHIIVSNETSTGEVWACQVTPFDEHRAGTTETSQSTLITLNPIITIPFPTEAQEFTYFYNGTIQVNTDINSVCSINDARYTLIANNGFDFTFFNGTINQSTNIVNATVTCTGIADNTSSNLDRLFYIDGEVPLITINHPVNGSIFAVNMITTNINIIDAYLDAVNITLYNNTLDVDYNNFSTYTNISSITLMDTLTGLTDGDYTLNVCARDSFQNSPSIRSATYFYDHTFNIDTIISKEEQTERDINTASRNDYKEDNTFLYKGVYISREINFLTGVGTQKRMQSIGYTSANSWDAKGEHLKTEWTVPRTEITANDVFSVTYQCLKGCEGLLYVNDRGIDRIIDDARTLYFNFDDAVNEGWDVTYQETRKNEVIVYISAPSEAFLNTFGANVTIDPITGGLNTICENVSFTVDLTAPTIDYTANSDLNGTYDKKANIFFNITTDESPVYRIDYLVYLANGSLFSNTSSTDTTQTVGVSFPNTFDTFVRIVDSAGNSNQTLTRTFIIGDGNPDRYAFKEPTMENIFVIGLLVAIYVLFFLAMEFVNPFFIVGCLIFGTFTGIYVQQTLNIFLGAMLLFILVAGAFLTRMLKS